MGSRRSWIEDDDAFADPNTEHAGELLLFFARRVLDPQTAFDLTAETFAQITATAYDADANELGSGAISAPPPGSGAWLKRFDEICDASSSRSESFCNAQQPILKPPSANE